MNVDQMRKIDFFVGVPLAFLFSLLLRPFLRRPRLGQAKRVLFVELSEMGSSLIVDPAMRKAKEQLGAELFFVIFKKNKPSLELLQTVSPQNVFTLRDQGLLALALDTLAFLRWTRRQGIDSVIDLELFSRFTALLTGLCGAANRVGFHGYHMEGLFRGSMLTHKVWYNPHQHMARNFLAMVDALASPVLELPFSKRRAEPEELVQTQVHSSPAELAPVRAKIEGLFVGRDLDRFKILLVNPNASELLVQRRWMPEYYRELITRVLAEFGDLLVVLTGAPGEKEEAEAMKAALQSDRVGNSAGMFKLVEMPKLYQLAHAMVTNDSGPGHFSSITGLPVFVIFGPETPELYGSLGNSRPLYAGLACSPCVNAFNHRKTPCTDNRCLQVITPDQVFEALAPALRSPEWLRLR